MLTGFGLMLENVKVKVLTLILCVLLIIVSCAMGGCAAAGPIITDNNDLMSCMLVGEAKASYPESHFNWEHLDGSTWIMSNRQGCSWDIWLEDGVIVRARMRQGPCDFNRAAFMRYAREKGCL